MNCSTPGLPVLTLSSMRFSIVAIPIYIPIYSVVEFLFLHTLSSIYYVEFLMMTVLTRVRWCIIVVVICLSLIISNVEHCFLCLLATCISYSVKCLVRSSAYFFNRCMNRLYILEIKSLSTALFANIFPHSLDCLFAWFMVSFAVQNVLIRSHLFIFYFLHSWRWIPKYISAIYV